MTEETVKPEMEKLPCTTCQLEFSNQSILDAHMSGSKHQKKILANQLLEKLKKTESCFTQDTDKGTFLCLICTVEVTSPQLLETHFSGTKHKNKAMGGEGANTPQQQQPQQKQQQQKQQQPKQQQPSNGQAGKRQLNPAAPPAKRIGAVAPPGAGAESGAGKGAGATTGAAGADSFKCKECDKSFNSEQQMTQHLSSSKHRNRCLIAMFGTCNLEDTLTKSKRGRGGQGSNNRGRGRGGSGGGRGSGVGRGRGNYQHSAEWESNSSTRYNSVPYDYGTNGLTQPPSDSGGCCSCGNRGRSRPNPTIQQQRTFTAAWEEEFDNIHYSNQSGYGSQGYNDESSAYTDQNTVASTTFTNQNHYSNQHLYVDRSRPCTIVPRPNAHDRGSERIHDRGSVSQGSYQQRGNNDQNWFRSGQSQTGGKGFQGGSRGKPRGKSY